PIYIKTNGYMLRQQLDNLVYLLLPCFTLKLCFFQIRIGKYSYFIRRPCNIYFFFTKIPNTDLYKFTYLRKLKCIIHDRSMRMRKSFIGLPEVHVCIKMQDTKICILCSQGLIIT